MPILYIHGVNTRSRAGFLTIEPLLRRLVAPEISDDPENVSITDIYWGEQGVKFAWNGASRPLTRLLGKGAGDPGPGIVERTLAADAYGGALAKYDFQQGRAAGAGPLSAPGAGSAPRSTALPSLTTLSRNDLSDLVGALSLRNLDAATQSSTPAEAEASAKQKARLLVAVDAVVNDPQTYAAMANESPERQIDLLLERVRKWVDQQSSLAGKGASWLPGLKDRVSETLGRAMGLPGYAASVLATEIRPALNETVSYFLGDVFEYLSKRVDRAGTPGPIPSLVLKQLREAVADKKARNNEPLVVLSHSMGGQIIWDAVTWFLPKTPGFSDIRIDFWCACASQVGFFEEAKLFAASDPAHKAGKPVPFPSSNLGVWWNVWDQNDFLSYTARDICDGVDDYSYNSGSSLLGAHGGYLERPSFFRELADRVKTAKARSFK